MVFSVFGDDLGYKVDIEDTILLYLEPNTAQKEYDALPASWPLRHWARERAIWALCSLL
jgi:hypothetical protein